MATSFQVTFDCANPDGLAQFWAKALGYELEPPPPGFESWPEFLKANHWPEAEWDSTEAVVDPAGVGPRLYFQKVPESKTVKNRVHLDVNVGGPRGTPLDERRRRVEDSVEHLVGLGATKIRTNEQHGEFWIVMQDPEGNEFCLQ